jgi:hypothetical protein
VLGRRTIRVALACAIALTATGVSASPVLAWSNGVDGPNAYGTHDWIVDYALEALGNRADWVCGGAALRATDDPDTEDGIDHASGTWWHVWDEWGEARGGAPEAARVWFERTQRRLEAGRECSASWALGIMSHFVADVAQPMHTDGSLDAEDRVHSAYESAVDSRSEAGDGEYGFDFDGIDEATARARTLRVARQAPPVLRRAGGDLRRARLQRPGGTDHPATARAGGKCARRPDGGSVVEARMRDLEDVDRRLRESLSWIPATDRDYLLRLLSADDSTRADAIGDLHATGLVPATVELLIDAEEEPALRALLVGFLREI